VVVVRVADDDMTFDRQPRLRGELVELRPLAAADFDALYAIASSPVVWEQHPSKDRTQETVFREWLSEALESGGALTAIDIADGSVIGSSRYHGYDEDRSEIEIGWTFLAPSYWGGTYNGEMKRLMLDHAFRFVKTVIFEIHSDNIRSQRAVEKLGAVRIRSQQDKLGRGLNYVFEIDAKAFTRSAK